MDYRCVCVCICVCMYIYMYVCMFVCVYVCMYVTMYVCMYVCMYDICMCVCMYVCMYICMYVHMYVCTYICMYVRMYLWVLCTYVQVDPINSKLKELRIKATQDKVNINHKYRYHRDLLASSLQKKYERDQRKQKIVDKEKIDIQRNLIDAIQVYFNYISIYCGCPWYLNIINSLWGCPWYLFNLCEVEKRYTAGIITRTS